MTRGQNPLIWMMAISLPGASQALGLGELHVDSALNEPLAAEIDIVGATAEELAGLSAKVANRDTFTRFGADRPAFLSTTTFKVTQDVHGHPVLAIRSSDSFTEPLVDFVVDLRWHNGELVRQYTLLLDPSGFSPAARLIPPLPAPQSAPATITIGNPRAAVAAAPPALPAPVATAPAAQERAASAPIAVPAQVDSELITPTAIGTRKTTHIKVGAKATLRGVAWRVGARSDNDLKRTMLAIFRANPSAFEGNINILHLGAMLTIPAQQQVDAIPLAEARREVRAQMAAWRSGAKNLVVRTNARAAPTVAAPAVQPPEAPARTAAPVPAPATATPTAAAATAAAAPAPAIPVDQTEANELSARIKSLESSLQEAQAKLEQQHNNLLNLQAQARYAEQHPAAPVEAPSAPVKRSYLTLLLSAGALLAGIAGAIWLRMRNRRNTKPDPRMPEISRYEEIDQRKEELKVPPAPSVEPVVARRVAPQPEPRIELHEMQDAQEAELSQSMAPAGAEDPIDTIEVETTGSLKAPEQDDDAAAKLREELALAWAIPAAETYGREDDEEHTLAEAIAKSLADTAKLKAVAEQEALAEDSTIVESMETANHTVIAASDTAMLSAATVNMDAEEVRSQLQRLAQNSAEESGAETVMMSAAAAEAATKLDYNLLDLDETAQHVHMPSALDEQAVAKERRTNLIDVLKMAIEREPDRRDLHMKLLETYFAAAATNREAFLEAVQKMAGARALKEGEWEKIAQMGRQIAADSSLFEEKAADDEDFADCA